MSLIQSLISDVITYHLGDIILWSRLLLPDPKLGDQFFF